MKQKFLIDTNIIIRILIQEPLEQAEQVNQLLEKVEEGECMLCIPSMVIAECCWVLQSFYKFSKSQIAEVLIEFILSLGIEVEESIVIDALKRYSDFNVDFIDAYLACKANSKSLSLITWNRKDFKKLNYEFYTPLELIS